MVVDNVCVVMENVRMFNMVDLLMKCKNFIFDIEFDVRRVFEFDGFFDFKREILLLIVELDELFFEENFIYWLLICWVKYNCVKERKENLNFIEI